MEGRSRLLTRSVRSKRERRNSLLTPAIEQLELLQLLSAAALHGVVASPQNHVAPAAKVTSTVPTGYHPYVVQEAYGFNQIAFDNGTVAGNGAGQTIAVVDAYNDPKIVSDLQKFDAVFGLPDPPKFTKAVQSGAKSNANWSLEIALDVEWAHAMAPAANILLVEAASSSMSNLLTAVNYAANQPGVSVVSMSWGGGEFFGESGYDSYFTTPPGHTGVTFVASSGDGGAGTLWPAVSPNVMAVGGTTLPVGVGGTYLDESAWTFGGGGYSFLEQEPSYQQSVQTTGVRTTPDVGYDANPATGVAIYDTVAYSQKSGWFQIGGTSAGAPQWAALIAIANQGRELAGLAPLSNANAAIYNLPASNFHDIVIGSNGYPTGPGYDLVTGIGSPIANLIVPGLVSTTVAQDTPSQTNSGGGTASNTKSTSKGWHSSSAASETSKFVLPSSMLINSPVAGSTTISSSAFALVPATIPISHVTPVRFANSNVLLPTEFANSLSDEGLGQSRSGPRASGKIAKANVNRNETSRNRDVIAKRMPTTSQTAMPKTDRVAIPARSTAVPLHVKSGEASSVSHGAVLHSADEVFNQSTDACFAKQAWVTELPQSDTLKTTSSKAKTTSHTLTTMLGILGVLGFHQRARSPKKDESHASA